MQAKVLFVDDEKQVLEGIKRSLYKEPIKLYFAQYASQVLDILAREDIDLIVSDERMPYMPGSELLKIVREKYPRTIRIMLTGHADVKAAQKAINEGKIYSFLSKPISKDKLLATIYQALTQKEIENKKITLSQQAVHLVNWEWSPKNNELRWSDNFPQLFGFTPATHIGHYRELFATVNALDRPFLVDAIKKCLQNRQGIEVEHRIETKKGSKWVSQLIDVVSNPQDEVIKVMGIAWDISEQKKQSQKLQAALKKLQTILEKTVLSLAVMVEKRDPFTAGHQQKVATIATAIAQEMGLDSDLIQNIHLASLLHDIGKNSIPLEYLTKPGRLTTLEMEIIKTHPQEGYEIVKEIPFNGPVAQIILQHHERLDGSGYPQGLQEKEIHIGAKVIAVADVYEAITSHRPYRPALKHKDAVQELTEGRGKLYDPKSVEILLKLIQKGKITV
ncbi:HD domain-containing phosphohydrolase [Desulfovulcanus sp.]